MAGDFDAKQPVRSLSADAKIDQELINGVAVAVNTGNANTGTQRVVLATDQPAVPISGPVAGLDVNLIKVVGTAADVNTGNASAGTLRVVLASDQPVVAMNETQVAGTAIAVNAGNASAGTQRVVIATDQLAIAENLTKVAGTAVDVNTGNASAGTLRVVLASDQPAISVNIGGSTVEKTTYRGTGVDVAVNGTDTNSYTPASTEKFDGFDASASAQIRVELKIGTTGSETTRGMYFSTASNKIISVRLPNPISVPSTDSIKLVITNKDNQVQPVYSTILTHV